MGATQNAIFTEMASTGAADKILTADTVDEAQMTYWRFVHSKHTPFAMEPVTFDATASQAKFNGSAKYQFPKQGDLAWQTYAVIQLPGIVAMKDGKVVRGEGAASYCNAVGQKLLQTATLAVGNTVIDTLHDVYLYAWEELSGKPGKKLGEMVGKFDTLAERQAFAKRSHALYVPLPFSFTTNSGLALPLVSLQFHSAQIELEFESKEKVVCAPAGATICVRPNGATDDMIDAGAVSVSPLQDADMQCEIQSNYVYLESDERTRFAKGAFEVVVEELQLIQQQAVASIAAIPTEASPPVRVNVRLQFNNVVSEYIFFARSQANAAANDWFNFAGPTDPVSGAKLDAIKAATVKFNNSARVQDMPGSYFRLVQPYQHHSNVPSEKFIYCWNYGIDPEDAQPSGGANHSRIDNVNMELQLDARMFSADAPTADIFIFARSKNVLRFKFGLITKRFV